MCKPLLFKKGGRTLKELVVEVALTITGARFLYKILKSNFSIGSFNNPFNNFLTCQSWILAKIIYIMYSGLDFVCKVLSALAF